MKNLLFILSASMFALQACHKSETEHVIYPYNRHYDVYYDKDRDSIHSFVVFNNSYGNVFLDNNESVTMNNTPVLYMDGNSYHWIASGKQDLVFKLTNHSGVFTNTVAATDIKAYDIVIPDTMSISKGGVMHITGPAYTQPEVITMVIKFSNNAMRGAFFEPGSEVLSFSADFFDNASTGKALIELTWVSNNIAQAHGASPSGSDDYRITTHTQKEIWLVP